MMEFMEFISVMEFTKCNGVHEVIETYYYYRDVTMMNSIDNSPS